MLNATKSSKRIKNVESMFEVHCFLQIMLMQVNFGNFQGVFPMPNSRVLTAPWTKNSQGRKHTLKRGIFSGLIKVVKETGVETRSFNSCFDGNSTSSTESYSLKGIRASICFCAKRQEQLHQLICCQNTFIVD